MAKAFSIISFFEQREKDPNEKILDMANLKKPFNSREILNNYSEDIDSFADPFHTHLHQWNQHRFRLNATRAKTRREKELLDAIAAEVNEEKKDKLNNQLRSYSARERKRLKQEQIEFLQAYASMLITLYLDNGLNDKAANIYNAYNNILETEFDLSERTDLFLPPVPKSRLKGILLDLEWIIEIANIWRLNVLFARIAFVDLINYASNNDLLKHLPTMDCNLSLDNLMEGIKNSKFVGHIFSVVLFVSRILIDLSLIIQTISDTDVERQNRISNAIANYKFKLTNDSVWSLVNGLTNFLEMPDSVLMAALLFDAVLVMWGWYDSKKTYQTKKAQYLEELKSIKNPDSLEYQATMETLKKICIDWEATNNTNMFVMTAAGILAMSCLTVLIAAPIIMSPAVVLPILGLVCDALSNLAVAMYHSVSYFNEWMQKRQEFYWVNTTLMLDTQNKPDASCWKAGDSDGLVKKKLVATNHLDETIHKQQLTLVSRECEMARNNFLCNITLYFLAPTALLGLSAICFPAAIAGSILYLGLLKCIIEPWWKKNQENELKQLRDVFLNTQTSLEYEEYMKLPKTDADELAQLIENDENTSAQENEEENEQLEKAEPLLSPW